MSLLALAILGKKNEPLYLCDCPTLLEAKIDITTTASSDAKAKANAVDSTDNDSDNENDPFGFFQAEKEKGLKESMKMEDRFRIHSALDQYFAEAIETSKAGLPVPLTRTGAWLGLLSKVDQDAYVYGHLTATNIKFFVLVQAQAKEAEVRKFLATIHQHYVTYVMNPFSKLHNATPSMVKEGYFAPISSNVFDANMQKEVKKYQDTRTFDV